MSQGASAIDERPSLECRSLGEVGLGEVPLVGTLRDHFQTCSRLLIAVLRAH